MGAVVLMEGGAPAEASELAPSGDSVRRNGVIGCITPEKQRAGQINGHLTQSRTSATMRLLWWDECKRLILAGLDSGVYIRRQMLIEGIRSYNLGYQITGKGGRSVKASTISRWLSEHIEDSIRLEVMRELRDSR